MNEHLGNLLSDNIAYESLHRCCRYNTSLTPENPAPSASSYTMYSSIPVNSSLCKCENTTHFKDYEHIVGRSNNHARRLKVDTVMTSALWNRVREHGSIQKNKKENTHSVAINDSQQAFPTEGAEKTREKKKARKLAGIKPNRKKMHVDHHFDDLGDDLSGLGVDIALLIADTELTDASNSDSDEEANALVHKWFGNQSMHAPNVTGLFSSMTSLRSSEPEILRLVAISNPEVAMYSVRKYNHIGPMFEASQHKI